MLKDQHTYSSAGQYNDIKGAVLRNYSNLDAMIC